MKKITTILLLAAAIALLVIFLYEAIQKISQQPAPLEASSFERIVSLSPNVTETLFALGLGDRVVGVTRFCNYPPEAKLKPKVGGYLDPNYEAILRLKPDVVVLISDFQHVKTFLSQLGINYLIVDNKTVADIRSSIDYLGTVFGAKPPAEKILNDIDTKILEIQDRTKAIRRPRVLIVIERTMGTGAIEDVYIAGRNTFYDELIQMAGGTNAYPNEKIAYPILAAEGIIHLDPEIIIDLVPQLEQINLDSVTLLKDWASLKSVAAVKRGRVYILSSDYAVIPGPRFILFLEDLARIIHPEIDG